MWKSVIVTILLLCLSASALAGPAEAGWTLDFCFGADYSLNMPLTISQDGYEDLGFTARWESRPFDSPFYYSVHLSRWKEGHAWELELVHQKIFLDNPPPEVAQFSISHGFNLLNVIRAWDRGAYFLRAGGGLVVTHPESTIRGLTHNQSGGLLGQGYYISGPTVQGAIGKRFDLGRKFFAVIEGKTTASYVRIPVADGNAELFNLAFHAGIGLGFDFR